MDNELFNELLESVHEAGRIRRGETPPNRAFAFDGPDVRAIRHKLGLSQPEFAMMLGVGVAALQNWEQGRRRPQGAAAALLRIADSEPDALLRALHGKTGEAVALRA